MTPQEMLFPHLPFMWKLGSLGTVKALFDLQNQAGHMNQIAKF
jgi:hypothetical protein